MSDVNPVVGVKELEAECAAMREALQSVAVNTCEACVCRDIECECDCSDRLRYASARAALSGDAGRALLERVEALERVATAAGALMDVLAEFGTLDGMSQSVDAVTDALDALEPKP